MFVYFSVGVVSSFTITTLILSNQLATFRATHEGSWFIFLAQVYRTSHHIKMYIQWRESM